MVGADRRCYTKYMEEMVMRYNGVQLCFDGFMLDDFEREAISFLREHEPPEGYFVGFSGGKDSIVTLQLVRMSGVKHTPYFTCTRIDPPEMYRFIKTNYPEITWLYPTMTLWDAIRKKAPPSGCSAGAVMCSRKIRLNIFR